MSTLLCKKVSSSFLTILLICSFLLAPISHTLQVKKSEAALATTGLQIKQLIQDVGTYAKTALSAAYDFITSKSLLALEIKEYTLDSIAWTLVNLVLKQMIKSMTRWVASGFQGSPAFVADLQGFLLDLADQVVGDFIYDTPLQFLCSPFKLNIQIALELQYNKTRDYQARCRLSSVMNNMQNFIDGDFVSGGWERWFDMTLTPENNQYGALFEAQVAMEASISNAQGQQIKLLEFGQGFFSQKDAKGNIVTPGKVIQDSLQTALDIPAERLSIADEINEFIGTLFAQLISSMLSSGKGLAGLNDSSSGPSYFDQIQTQADQQGMGGGQSSFDNDIKTINDYIAHQNTIIASVNSAMASGPIPQSLQNARSTAQTALTNAQTTLTQIQTYQSDYNALGNASTPVATKNALMTKYSATTAIEAQTNILSTYSSFASNTVPDVQENITLETTTIPSIQEEVDRVIAQNAQASQSQFQSTSQLMGTP